MVSIISQLTESIAKLGNAASALHQPEFAGNEWQYVKECIDTAWVSSAGKYVDLFEQKLAEYTGAKYVIATVNGTAALHMCFILASVQPGDEVLVPTVTFVATCNAVHYCQATPHFVDSDQSSLGVDPQKLENYLQDITDVRDGVCFNTQTGKPIRALCVMHTFGHPADLDVLKKITDEYGIALVEDAAEALGSYYKGQHVGNHGLVSSLSFNGNKVITTGGGGAILTNDESIAKLAKHLTTTAKQPHQWEYHHDQVGYNYRLPNINAALGCAQLEQLPRFLMQKRALFKQYQALFSNMDDVHLVQEPVYAASNYWLNALRLDDSTQKDALLAALNESGIGARPIWELMHRLPMYRDCPSMNLSCAEQLAQQMINIPSSAALGATEAHAHA